MVALFRFVFLAPLGFLLGSLAAGFILTYAFYEGPPPVLWPDMFLYAGFYGGMTVQAATVAFFPAMLAIVVGEMLAWRGPVYWLLAGGVIGLLPLFAPVPWQWIEPPGDLLGIYAAAGFAGAFVYWLVAGRLAGSGLSSDPRRGPA